MFSVSYMIFWFCLGSSSAPAMAAPEPAGPRQVRVLLLRHGQGEHNVANDDEIPDAVLTADGELQASSWASP